MDELNLIVSIVGIILSSIIAYHVHFLSRKILFKDKLKHELEIRKKIKSINLRIWNKEIRNRVYLVDVDNYDKYPYDSNSSLSGGLKGCHLGGVVIERHTSKEIKLSSGELEKVVMFGVIPYEWIVDININGDDANNSSIIYCRFKNKKKKKILNMKRSREHHLESMNGM